MIILGVRPVTDMATELKEERYWGYPIMDKTDGSTVGKSI